MLIDEIIYDIKVAHKKIVMRGWALALPPEQAEAQVKALDEQLSALDALTPRYKVDNVYAPLNPKLLHVDTDAAKKKDEVALAYRNHVLEVASKAPMSPPWWTFWMEFTYPATKQRVGVVLRYDSTFSKWVGTLGFDRYSLPGEHEYFVDAFELLLDPSTQMYGTTKFNLTLGDIHMQHVIPALAEIATVFIQLKNYYKKQNGVITPLVGQQTIPPPAAPSRNQPCSCGSGLKWKHCHGKGNPSKPPSHPAKPSPETVLLLDPFMQEIKKLKNGHGNGTHASPKLHLRSGGWRNYTMQNPLGGAIAWQTGTPKKLTMGKNYGRIYFAPTDPTKPIGDPSRGVSTKRSRIELGKMEDPNRKEPGRANLNSNSGEYDECA
ncbi:MAG: SEC-C domain-containing protein [Terriglobales bacterium]